MKDVTPYEITLTETHDFDDCVWTWELSQGGEFLASSRGTFRWTAKLGAKRAARRHAKGKDPLYTRNAKSNTFYYRPGDRSL